MKYMLFNAHYVKPGVWFITTSSAVSNNTDTTFLGAYLNNLHFSAA